MNCSSEMLQFMCKKSKNPTGFFVFVFHFYAVLGFPLYDYMNTWHMSSNISHIDLKFLYRPGNCSGEK